MDTLGTLISQLEHQKHAIEKALTALRSVTSDGASNLSAEETAIDTGRPKRKFSAATRRKMALAQRRRYAALRRETRPESSAAPTTTARRPKRKMSAQAIANIRAGVRKRIAKKAASARKKTATR
jgi:hypothetical protein